ncbi:hypothetical protein KAFR_0C03970 [Kazachstania africana CBS 2517]|uniref:CHY-type domain-containing protein n=1 Tax=Kazachstania africana (strain ATCC 22294 / BCRC 22015 / CBS 2517 / CECT 1963 / NBRC 1671 / NRRL Y-8276) TaxID=1071382 RepID=H2ASN8_KAZAF|nr:hypothetical protein KAFR_0C03970 [Kazachstania africana CBS 2517]CCF57388.1 hypothetical protein KAFR_0C03970 [Kazachstania africana CBS 2517]
MQEIFGKPIDNETRCVHWNSENDIIAIKFKCCNKFYPCFQCHEETTDHELEKFNREDDSVKTILCGHCHNEMTFNEYKLLHCKFCQSQFNPYCKLHYDHYFH